MKRTARILALAAALAIVALGLGATSAVADPIGPGGITTPTGGDPEPRPEIDDKAPPPQDDPERPDGPDDLKDNDPCPTHGPCGDVPEDRDEPEEGDEPGGDFDVPTRIDAGAGASDDPLELAWILAGGGLITASGVAMAARRRLLTEV